MKIKKYGKIGYFIIFIIYFVLLLGGVIGTYLLIKNMIGNGFNIKVLKDYILAPILIGISLWNLHQVLKDIKELRYLKKENKDNR